MRNKLAIYDDNGYCIFINDHLLTRQNAWSNLEEIKNVHQFKLAIYSAIRDETNPKVLKSYVEDLTLCEFELQKLWKFKKDINYHKFWMTPKCQCPDMDNNDIYPLGNYIINSNCPLHS